MPYGDTAKMIRKPDPTSHHSQNSSGGGGGVKSSNGVKMGIYGWRKRCLYMLILALMLMMIVNLALTLWILKVMDFNMEGMGQLRIVPGGLQLLGQAMILDTLYASTLRSRRGQPISIESSKNFSVVTRDESGRVANRLFLGNDRMECSANSFRITDTKGSPLFSASPRGVEVGAEKLTMTGSGGVEFDGSIQTPLIKSSAGSPLILESPTRSLEMKAVQSINIESRSGDITASCLSTLKLESIAGNIRLEASSVYIPKLRAALPLPPAQQHSRDPRHHDIYQLCSCASGKLFLAPPHGACAAREDSFICR